MKPLYILLLAISFQYTHAKEATAPLELVTINQYWSEQDDINQLSFTDVHLLSDHELIRLHLKSVEKTLRARSTTHLTFSQKANRTAALNHLNKYWHEGNFPVNNKTDYRTPIFIDDFDNFCAVGYLMKATGFEYISRMVQANNNLAYVYDMDYPELNQWAKDYGFTVGELAWIQPTYSPYQSLHSPISHLQMPDSFVYELYVDSADHRLFVGGEFINIDQGTAANHIAYITEVNGQYKWHKMNGGTDGPVYAIAEYQNRIFAAGSFKNAGNQKVENVAFWDGKEWNKAGCLNGDIKDMILYDNKLYACGEFDNCSSPKGNFAVWNGTTWDMIYGLNGYVNTLHITTAGLVLGGKFSYNSTTNVIVWSNNQFTEYQNGIGKEVMDIEMFLGTLRAACKGNTSTDNDLFYNLQGNIWVGVPSPNDNTLSAISYNALCAHETPTKDDRLWAGGEFILYDNDPNTLTQYNCLDATKEFTGSAAFGFQKPIAVNGTINKLILFKDVVFGAGYFHDASGNYNIKYLFRKNGSYTNVPIPSPFPIEKGSPEVLDNLSFRTTSVTNIPQEQYNLFISPNPVLSGTALTIKNNIDARKLTLIDINGRKVFSETLVANNERVQLPSLPSGMYTVELQNKSGEIVRDKLLIK